MWATVWGGLLRLRGADGIRLPQRWLPPEPWRYTDDTAMALSVVRVLAERGCVDPDALAAQFAARYAAEPDRGYGPATHEILSAIGRGDPGAPRLGGRSRGGAPWATARRCAFGPVGAYFADDPAQACREAADSARVTHAHPEGVAGAVAVAMAAAVAASTRRPARPRRRRAIAPNRLGADSCRSRAGRHHPRDASDWKSRSPWRRDCWATAARHRAGHGRVLPVVRRPAYIDSYEEAMWSTVSALGDADTNCAIVGSIVVMRNRRRGDPRPLANRPRAAIAISPPTGVWLVLPGGGASLQDCIRRRTARQCEPRRGWLGSAVSQHTGADDEA